MSISLKTRSGIGKPQLEPRQPFTPHITKEHTVSEYVDDSLVQATRILNDIYRRSNGAICEAGGPEKAFVDLKCRRAIQEEMEMIEKIQTLTLVNRPINKYVIGVK